MDTTSTTFINEISNDMSAFITKSLSEQRRSASVVVPNIPMPEVTRRMTSTNPVFHEPNVTPEKAPTDTSAEPAVTGGTGSLTIHPPSGGSAAVIEWANGLIITSGDFETYSAIPFV